MTSSTQCPICNLELGSIDERQINAHIDECLTNQFLQEQGDERGNTSETIISDIDTPPIELLNESNSVSESLFIDCPYPTCRKRLLTYELLGHATENHSTCSQQLSCPICFLETGENYAVNQKTNLIDHLQKVHGDISEMQKVLIESRQLYSNQMYTQHITTTTTTTRTYVLPPKIGNGYTIQTLKKELNKECPICFEEFEKGTKVAWMECFCVFHETCIDQWFKKSQKQLCPVHRDDDNNDTTNNNE